MVQTETQCIAFGELFLVDGFGNQGVFIPQDIIVDVGQHLFRDAFLVESV